MTQLRHAQGDPLPSWNDGPPKQSILSFVAAVSREGSPDFVPAPQRIATFDNDGTLWIEQPMYVQLAFVLDRVKALAPMHPEWKEKQPFKAVLEGDMKTLAESGERGMIELGMVTHAGMTPGEFEKIVSDWLASARHPRFKRPYIELIYQPVLELMFVRKKSIPAAAPLSAAYSAIAWNRSAETVCVPPRTLNTVSMLRVPSAVITIIARTSELPASGLRRDARTGATAGYPIRPILGWGPGDCLEVDPCVWVSEPGCRRHRARRVHPCPHHRSSRALRAPRAA